MGKLKNGILGGFTGKVGPIVAYLQDGVYIMRSKGSPRPKRKAQNPASLPQQLRMKLASKFASSVDFILKRTVFPPLKKMTNKNFVTQQVMKFAIAGEYPDLFIDYSKVQLSYGFLPTVNNATVTRDGDNLVYDWMPNAIPGSQRALDNVLLLAYNAETRRLSFKFAAATRNDDIARLPLKKDGQGEFETWMVFISEKGNEASPTIYCGKVVVTAG